MNSNFHLIHTHTASPTFVPSIFRSYDGHSNRLNCSWGRTTFDQIIGLTISCTCSKTPIPGILALCNLLDLAAGDSYQNLGKVADIELDFRRRGSGAWSATVPMRLFLTVRIFWAVSAHCLTGTQFKLQVCVQLCKNNPLSLQPQRIAAGTIFIISFPLDPNRIENTVKERTGKELDYTHSRHTCRRTFHRDHCTVWDPSGIYGTIAYQI